MHNKLLMFLVAIIAAFVFIAPLQAQALRPHEPFDPGKAQSLPTSPLTVVSDGKPSPFTVELADTPKERDIGLMHRNFLAADRGMLFTFETEQREQFWMRNTFIPLDIVFIRGDAKIEYIAENARPHDETPLGPRAPVIAVLELPGGTAKRLGLKRGDVVHHAFFRNLESR